MSTRKPPGLSRLAGFEERMRAVRLHLLSRGHHASLERTRIASAVSRRYTDQRKRAMGTPAAKGGPNVRHQSRMASQLTRTPRSASRPSISRWLRWNRKYSQTAWLMISAGTREPR